MSTDQISILISIIVFLIVGYYYKSIKTTTIKEFTMQEGKLNWFPIAAGISMTFAGGAAILNMASLGYAFKWYTLVDPISLVLGILIVILLFNKYWNDKGITISNLLSSSSKELNVLIGIITSIVFILILSAQFVALSKLVSPYFNNINELFITFILSTAIFSYVYIGGFSSVTKTDILQFIFISLFLLIPTIIFTLSGSIENEVILKNDHSFSRMPINYIILFSIPILFTPLSQDVNIRIKSAKDKKNGKIGLIVGSIIYFSIVVCSSFIGIYLAKGGVTLEDSETAYSIFFQTYFKNFGFIGIIAALAAIVSSLDSYTLNGITSVSNDLLFELSFFKKIKHKNLIHIASMIVYIISLAIALFFNEILVLVLTALLLYISVLFPIAFSKILRMNSTYSFFSAILIIIFILLAEILKFDLEPKAIIYPIFGLFIMIVSFTIQRVRK